ncbi:divalent-cation tolerance protein CutA [Novosphingobium colocasiae]|uniref:Divalent-cation tolerance protein CutA n=1 Tax=Novosphingobium colocasiae TaxID=1256513 RepID=A0A918UD94_9SPHN|nr:divalent-cation tolerance protein CutA [Novosphingobium colocasiae]GGY91064.1 hypothetical protein GCM10011614_02180 [Novosphingobium colocasiae]
MAEAQLPAPALIWCPFPDEAAARAVAGALLDEGLAACANLVPGLTSLFVWNGARDEAREIGMLVKTNAALLDAAVARLGMLHPYEEPAITGWICDAASAGTRVWLGGISPAAI